MEVFKELNRRYPLVFDIKSIRPLEVNIHSQLRKEVCSSEGISHTKLKEFLDIWTTSFGYVRALAMEDKRLNLEGEPSQDIDEKVKNAARKALKRY